MVPSGTGPGAGLPKERKIRSRVKVIVWCYSRFCVQNVVRNVVIHILSFIFKEYARFQILYCIIVPFGLTLSDWSLSYLKRYSNDAGCFKSLASSYLWRNTFHLTYCCFYCSKRSMAKLKWTTEVLKKRTEEIFEQELRHRKLLPVRGYCQNGPRSMTASLGY